MSPSFFSTSDYLKTCLVTCPVRLSPRPPASILASYLAPYLDSSLAPCLDPGPWFWLPHNLPCEVVIFNFSYPACTPACTPVPIMVLSSKKTSIFCFLSIKCCQCVDLTSPLVLDREKLSQRHVFATLDGGPTNPYQRHSAPLAEFHLPVLQQQTCDHPRRNL